MPEVKTVIGGFPGRTSRGFLGWGAAYVVITDDGEPILFDTGASNDRATLLPTLARLSVDVNAIHTVVLSHLHFDHSANWDLFPQAEMVVHATEMEHARTAQGPKSELAYRVRALEEGAKLRVVHGESDLRPGIRLLHVPGHTAGCMALHFGRTVVCGDSIKTRWDLRGEIPKGGSMWSADAFIASIRRIIEVADLLYLGHDVPFERSGDSWKPIGFSSESIYFPDGQSCSISYQEKNAIEREETKDARS